MNQFFEGLFSGILAMVILMLWRLRSHKALLHHIIDSLYTLRNGRYDIRMYPYRKQGTELAVFQEFNAMAEHVSEEFDALSQERDILRYILENMTTGVVYLRGDGQVHMVNRSAERIFRRPSEQWQERDHWTIFRNYTLVAAIDHALLFATEWMDELTIRDGVVATVRLVPIQAGPRGTNRHESSYDVLMLVNDVSEWRRLEHLRSEFVANVSHELKTPIAVIRGYAETLLDADVGEDMKLKFLQTIYDESMRMNNLVSDLLELSKLEAADSHVEPISVNLISVVEKAMDRVRPVAERRQIRMHLVDAPQVTVWAEPDMLLQVFLNLLSNAVHYSLDNSDVFVTWDILIDRAKVHVRDRGVGIPTESLGRVFERFYRVHKDRSRASGGTGLGLAIVKHIVTSLGGDVGVDSKVGEGSDFWFTLSRLDAETGTTLKR